MATARRSTTPPCGRLPRTRYATTSRRTLRREPGSRSGSCCLRLAFRSHSIRPVSGHTFLCGQSGSGKTYSLGVVLERLLLETDLRLISDFARLGELRLDTNDAETARYLEATRSLAVRRAGDGLALLLAGLERDEGGAGRRREERRPVMIVVDEAHNVCPARPEDPLIAIATEYAVRIAGEGRKFGLYLLVSTQRPQKVHENVLSQCDNLLLMRMNSLADLVFVSGVFS